MAEPTIRVLYIDDDLALVRLAQKALSRRGFEVSHAANVDEAMSHLAAGTTDVIALDHYLPSATGIEFLGVLAGLEQIPPVVYVTGSTEMNVAVAALKAGAADFVPKTIGDDFLALLGAALEQAVDKARLRKQKEIAEHEVRMARDRAEVLLAEMNHRIANSLTLVSSLVGLQASVLADQVAKDALAETQARIYAISLVHRRLYSSGDARVVQLHDYLNGLLEHLGTSMRSEGHATTLTFDLAPLNLPTDASINLGVIVTEWVTNAFKYAYPNGSGEVRVRLAQLPGDQMELVVEDDGIGRMDGEPARGTGLGTKIVRAMAQSMGAEIEYRAREPGTLARLVAPLSSA